MPSLGIRARLTLAFAVSMAIAFTALGVFIHIQFRQDLERALDQGLRERIGLAAVAERGTHVQRYAADGRVIGTSADLAGERLLTADEVRRAAAGPITIERRAVGGEDLRIRAARFEDGAAAAGEPLRVADRELRRLRTLLLVAFPLALVLASYAGFEVAGAALAPLERVRARERRLVADTSHELRTPLTVLRTELQLALRGDRDKPQLREALENALSETERLTRLADDLLVLARADQGKLPLRREAIDVAQLLAARAEQARPHADGRPITVAGDGTVEADPDRIVQALDNLVYNAINHGEGEVELRAVAVDGAVELHVLDEGPGFADLGRAFERFAHDGGAGTGLGLAIVQSIASAHGGTAGASNRPAGGADVWIALPRG